MESPEEEIVEHEGPDPELMFDEDLANVFTTGTEVEEHIETEHVVEIESEQATEEQIDPDAAEDAEAAAIASINIQMHGEEVDVDITEETIPAHEFLIATDGSLIAQQMEQAVPVELSPEEQLKSTEKLDRSSPDLWPTNLPTTARQILHNNQLKTGETDSSGSWAQGLDPEDINLLHQFGSLTSSSLVEEVKKLQNIAYQLALDEKKEMTRGKLLGVLGESRTVLKEADASKRRWK